ncbi:MAG: NAD-dependent deacetylase [Chloroflexi bacterium]|jgi:NAD-dependent deacetylase|nr:MAG: NAD-dependent deacetylase [Chloroflexota bacterium]
MTMAVKKQNPISAAAKIIVQSQYPIALIGAGLSVGSGIPTFRDTAGLWTKLGEPSNNRYEKFLADPKKWWNQNLNAQIDPERTKFREAIEKAKPNPGHLAMVDLEKIGVLKHQITQNIDNLHYIAGSNHLTEIHGNRTKLRCISCDMKWHRDEFDQITLGWQQNLPPKCNTCFGIVKPDTVMFGEPIPLSTLNTCVAETRLSDCILVIGTSATVYPAAGFPREVLSSGGKIIEINPEETPISEVATESIKGPTEDSLPKLVAEIKGITGNDPTT